MGSGLVMLVGGGCVLGPSPGFKARLDRFFLISSGTGVEGSIVQFLACYDPIFRLSRLAVTFVHAPLSLALPSKLYGIICLL